MLLVAPPSLAGVPDVLPAFFPVPRRRAGQHAARLLRRRSVLPGGRRTRSTPGRADVLPGQGHINPDAGYGPWPAVEAWARDGAVPLTAR